MISPCASTGWSAVSSALANATVAGLLAGFMLNGIVVLLSRQPDRAQRVGYVQAASLLFGAFVTLGLDSFLFGLVTGDTSQVACRRAWSEAMLAAGLLGLGTVAVVVSIVFLLGVFFAPAVRAARAGGHQEALPGLAKPDPASTDDQAVEESNDLLAMLCSLLRPGVALLVVGLLVMTATSYLFAVFRGHAAAWIYDIVWACWGFDYLVIGAFCLVYIWYVWARRKNLIADQLPGRDPPEAFFNYPVLAGLINPVMNEFLRFLRGGVLLTLRWGIFLTVGYTLASVGFSVGFVLIPVHAWNSSSDWVQAAVAGTIIWVLVGSLVPVATLLMPSYGPMATPRRKKDATA